MTVELGSAGGLRVFSWIHRIGSEDAEGLDTAVDCYS
jgi:hypothetical protein